MVQSTRRAVRPKAPGVNLYFGRCSDCGQDVGKGHGPVTGSHAAGYQIHCAPARRPA